MRSLQTLGDEGMNQPVKFHELAVLGRDGRLPEICGKPREGFLLDFGGRGRIVVVAMIGASQHQVLLRGCHGIEVSCGLPHRKLRSAYGSSFISGGQLLLAFNRVGERGKRFS